MYVVRIKTIGEVAFSGKMKMTAGYRYDIPFDELQLPYFSFSELLREKNIVLDNIAIGAAHPLGYTGIADAARKLLSVNSNCAPFIRGAFTNDRFITELGYSIRSLKAGQEYYAYIGFAEERKAEVRRLLSSVKQLGISVSGITGEVSMRLEQASDLTDDPAELSSLCRYNCLRYTLMLTTPACFYDPFGENAATHFYVPASAVKQYLGKVKSFSADDIPSLRFTHAYISNSVKRLLPTPACVSVIKLEREQLRYRLASGKKADVVEQDIDLIETYCEGVDEHLVRYTRPETERITSPDGRLLDALSPGQMFSGMIFGSDKMIRSIAAHFEKEPMVSLGELSDCGFGEAYVRIDGADEERESAPTLCSEFDVCCLSDTLIYNSEGMAACTDDVFVDELEYILNAPDTLTVVGKYTKTCSDHTQGRPVCRCLAKGSVFRVRTKSGDPIDVSPILHCFAGERTDEGYGEIAAYPAVMQYYKAGQELAPTRYKLGVRFSYMRLNEGARFTTAVLTKMLQSRITGLAYIDRDEYKDGADADELYPVEIVSMLKQRYAPAISDELLKKWYKEGLENYRYE